MKDVVKCTLKIELFSLLKWRTPTKAQESFSTVKLNKKHLCKSLQTLSGEILLYNWINMEMEAMVRRIDLLFDFRFAASFLILWGEIVHYFPDWQFCQQLHHSITAARQWLVHVFISVQDAFINYAQRYAT